MRTFWDRFIGRRGDSYAPSSKVAVPDVWFLGEQVGAPEDDLKNKLKAVFHSEGTVTRAYLAIVQYGPKVPTSVALCVVFTSGRNDPRTISLSAIAFHEMFSTSAMLDIIPITASQERTLSRVCSPFYEA